MDVPSSRLQRLLGARWPAVRDAWPGVSLDFDAFCDHVAERLPAGADVEHALAALRLDELYIACACQRGDAQALALLEARYFPGVVAALRRLRLDAAVIDELQQRLRRRLFVAEGGRRPRIGRYGGRGALASWLRVTAVRAALKQLKRPPLEVTLLDGRRAPPAAEADIELGYLKRHYRPLFRAAFAEAVATLDDRERRLLRQYYVEGLTIEQMGVAQKAHRMTVGRWLDAVRQRLLAETRRALMRRVQVSQRECDSILRMVHSQLDLTFRRLVCTVG